MKNIKMSRWDRLFFNIIKLLLLPLAVLPGSQINADDTDNLQLERFEQALALTPNIDNGRKLYRLCITCHGPEGWGTQNGSYPQIAGQLPTTTIKQLGDICSKQRGNPIMEAFTTPRVLESAQDVADLAGYIANLPMTDRNGQGYSRDISLGIQIYNRNCKECHGDKGEGHVEDFIPRIQGQHYNYLMRQFSWIRGGHRQNADRKMIRQIQNFSLREESAVMSYVASLKPSQESLAEAGWKNPDFPKYDRRWSPSLPRLKPLRK